MAQTKFKVGDRVTHGVYGKGVVLINDGTDFMPVAVKFDNGGGIPLMSLDNVIGLYFEERHLELLTE